MKTRQLRIAVVTPVFPTSAEPYRGNYNYSIVRSLQRHAEIEVSVPVAVAPQWRLLRPRSTRYNTVDVTYSPGDVNVKYLPYRSIPVLTRPINGLTVAARLKERVGRFRPDVILSYWIYPEGYGALRVAGALGVPLVLGALGSDIKLLSDPITNHLVIHTLTRASMVITVSEDMRQVALANGAMAQRVRTIVNGCDVKTFYPQDRDAARQRLGLPRDIELVVFVGWLSPTKGVRELMDAVLLARAKRPRLTLACIGDGGLAEEIRAAEVATGGAIRLIGRKMGPQIAEWLAAANCLSLPSHSEGYPNVVVEALACGRPVVATRVGGIPEIVRSHSGILVAPENPRELAAGLLEALDRRWDPARIAAEQSRSWDDVADETYEVCEAAVRAAEAKRPAPARAAAPDRAPAVHTGRPLRVAVITPMFPTAAEPYRGWSIYKTAIELNKLANVKVICPIRLVPRWQPLQPRSLRYHDEDTNPEPGSLSAEYLHYRSPSVIGRPWNGSLAAAAIGSSIEAFAPDVILAYWIYPEGYAALRVGRRLGVPVIIGSRGSDMRLGGTISRRLSLDALRSADHVLTVSEELRRLAIGFGVPGGRVTTVVNGIERGHFHVGDRRAARRDIGVEDGIKLIVFIGWLNASKGVEELLAAMPAVLAARGDARAVLIGEGPLRKKVMQVGAGQLGGRVSVAGPLARDTIAKWLIAADLLCLPSWSEGCPNVVLEALACGRPVVGAAVGGIPELIAADNGILIEPRRADQLAAALIEALGRDWDEDAISRAHTRAWSEVAAETFEVCRAVAERAGRGTPARVSA